MTEQKPTKIEVEKPDNNGETELEFATFKMPVTLPYIVPSPNCCIAFMAQVDLDPDSRTGDDVIVYYRHSLECDVWSYL